MAMRRLLCLLVAAGALQGAAAPLRVLFLGNSYTYYYHLAGLVEGMASAADGRAVEARSGTKGCATLETLFRDTDALAVLRGGKWDVVVLQEQSTLGVHLHNGAAIVNLSTAFHTWARVWDAIIRAHGARTVFLQTWARHGRREQQPQLNGSYAAIAKELDAGVIPAGMGFQLVDGIELYQPDGSHLSAAGSYLAACAAVQQSVETPIPPRPAFSGEPEPALHPLEEWSGGWEGITWQYRKLAQIILPIEPQLDGGCSGVWRVTSSDSPTGTTIPLEDCTVTPHQLRSRIRTLFLTNEQHEVFREGAALRGRVTIRSATPYLLQEGTWTLQRGKP